MRDEIESLLRACDTAGHMEGCATPLDGQPCDCQLRELTKAAAAVRAALATMPVPDGGLRPCPFCGGQAAGLRIDRPLPNGMIDTLYQIACNTRECGASTREWFPKESAARAWNRREKP